MQDKKTWKALTKKPPPNGDGVGYGKPPKSTQFKKGTSGNPSGRPKGSKNKSPSIGDDPLRALILREANRKVDVREAGGSVSYSILQTVVRSVAVRAAKGEPRAQKLFLELAAKAHEMARKEQLEFFAAAVEYKQSWTDGLHQRALMGGSGPEPFPHPDDIIIDPRTGNVRFKGPVTKEEKEIFDFLLDREQAFGEEVEALKGALADEGRRDEWDSLERALTQSEQDLQFFREQIAEFRGEPLDATDIVRAHREMKARIERSS